MPPASILRSNSIRRTGSRNSVEFQFDDYEYDVRAVKPPCLAKMKTKEAPAVEESRDDAGFLPRVLWDNIHSLVEKAKTHYLEKPIDIEEEETRDDSDDRGLEITYQDSVEFKTMQNATMLCKVRNGDSLTPIEESILKELTLRKNSNKTPAVVSERPGYHGDVTVTAEERMKAIIDVLKADQQAQAKIDASVKRLQYKQKKAMLEDQTKLKKKFLKFDKVTEDNFEDFESIAPVEVKSKPKKTKKRASVGFCDWLDTVLSP